MSTKIKIQDAWNEISTKFYCAEYCVEQWFEDRKWFWKNLKSFHKSLTKFRPWDSQYTIDMFTRSLEILRNEINKGPEINLTRNKKVAKMDELIALLKIRIDDIDIEQIDPNLKGEERYKAIDDLYAEHFHKIFRLIEGTSNEEFDKRYKKIVEEYKEKHNGEEPNPFDAADEAQDGSGIMTWWG